MRTPTTEIAKTRWMAAIAVVLAIVGFLAAVLATGNLIDGAIGAITNGVIGLVVGLGIDKLRGAR